MQIVELRGLENGRYVLHPLYRFNTKENRLDPTEFKPRWI
jgi:hypothetical protein